MNHLMTGIIDAFMPSEPVLMNETNIFIEPTTSINRINRLGNITGRINEADCRIMQPVSTSKANCSTNRSPLAKQKIQRTAPVNKADIETTVSKNEADIEPNCSLQLLSPVNKENIEPTAAMLEADIKAKSFVHMTSSIDVTEVLIEPTVSSNKENIEPNCSLQLILPVNKVEIETTSVKNTADVEPTAVMNEEGIETNSSVNLTSANDLMDMTIEPTALINRLLVKSNSCVRLTVPTKESTNNNNTTDLVDMSATIITNEFQEALEIFKWIESKLDLLKIIQDNEENQEYSRIIMNELESDKRSVLQEILEETRKMTAKNALEESGYLSKDVTRMLDMLQETTLGFLDALNRSESRCPNIKVLSTLILHLSSSIGSKVTVHDIQAYINGKHILQLYNNVQISREPRFAKMANFKRYLEHGVKKTQVLKRKSTPLKNKIELAIVKCSDVQNANETLKDLGRESEDLLLKYADLVRYLMTKAKSFVTLKNDSDRVLGQFITKEIADMYKE